MLGKNKKHKRLTNKDIQDKLVQVLIDKIEHGQNPWRKEWKTIAGYTINCPMNYFSNKPYRGINYVLLETGFYLSFKQIQELGGKLKKGSSGIPVMFSKKQEYVEDPTDDTDEDKIGEDGKVHKTSLIYEVYYVFPIEETIGCRQMKHRPLIREVKDEEYDGNGLATKKGVERIINDYCQRAKLKVIRDEVSKRAFYSLASHSVKIPMLKQFSSIATYYATEFHELGHSTGAKQLLNRDFGASFGSSKYAFEELVAEITSTLCMAKTNLESKETIDNSAAYLRSWLKSVNTTKDFKTTIWKASGLAFKAKALIFNEEPIMAAQGV